MSAVRVLPVTSMVRALRVMSWVVAMLMWVLQVVCLLVAPLVLSLRRVLLGVLWAVVSSVVPMARGTQAMHWVTVRPVCAVGDALGTGGGGPEWELPLVQRAMVALVPQVVDWVIVLLVMLTRWFVCLSARGVGAGVGRLPVRVVVAVGLGAPGAWWAWLGAGARVGLHLVRVAGGLWAVGALLPCLWLRAVWSSVAGVCFAWVVWGLVGVGGVGVGVWGWVLVAGVSSACPVWVLWVVLSLGVLQVWCGVDGGVPGDSVVSTAEGEGVVGDAVNGGVTSERLAGRRGRQCGRAQCWVLRCVWSDGGGCGW